MADVAIVIVTHGNFGKELLKSVEMIMGEQKDVVAFGLNLGDDVETLKENVRKTVEENQSLNKTTLIMVDLLGGSPSNIALSLLKDYDVKVLVGINMPMLIEILSSKDYCGIDVLMENGYKAGIEGIKKFDFYAIKVDNKIGE
jgi:PTS system mannose-specific IIA component